MNLYGFVGGVVFYGKCFYCDGECVIDGGDFDDLIVVD